MSSPKTNEIDPLLHPLQVAKLLAGCGPGLVVNCVFDEPGDVVYAHACSFGCEGIVSKRRGSRYVDGRTNKWCKVKNPAAPAVRREAEEHWGRR